jgi:hypothetical protein
MEEAFNDMNLHIFEKEKIEATELWKDIQEPPPFDKDDPELICKSHQNTS